MHNYHNLEVWKEGVDFVAKIYATTVSFPNEEVFGLTSQLRRASLSIPSNIAEGEERESPKEQMRFLNIAKASTAELITQIYIGIEVGFIDKKLDYH